MVHIREAMVGEEVIMAARSGICIILMGMEIRLRIRTFDLSEGKYKCREKREHS